MPAPGKPTEPNKLPGGTPTFPAARPHPSLTHPRRFLLGKFLLARLRQPEGRRQPDHIGARAYDASRIGQLHELSLARSVGGQGRSDQRRERAQHSAADIRRARLPRSPEPRRIDAG